MWRYRAGVIAFLGRKVCTNCLIMFPCFLGQPYINFHLLVCILLQSCRSRRCDEWTGVSVWFKCDNKFHLPVCFSSLLYWSHNLLIWPWTTIVKMPVTTTDTANSRCFWCTTGSLRNRKSIQDASEVIDFVVTNTEEVCKKSRSLFTTRSIFTTI